MTRPAPFVDRDIADIQAEFAARRREGPATAKHGEIVDRLVAAILAKHNDGKNRMNPERITQGLDPYALDEIKTLEVSHTAGQAGTFLLIEVGMVNDEGTYASIFARDRRHISIGKRGGLTLLNAKPAKGRPRHKSPRLTGRHNAVWALTD